MVPTGRSVHLFIKLKNIVVMRLINRSYKGTLSLLYPAHIIPLSIFLDFSNIFKRDSINYEKNGRDFKLLVEISDIYLSLLMARIFHRDE